MSRYGQQQIRFGPRLTPVVKKLLIFNIGLHIFFLLLGKMAPGLNEWVIGHFALVPQNFYIWQMLTYSFLHFSISHLAWNSISHLAWNMIALWMFGCDVEGMWGRRPFLLFYLLCAFGGAVGVLLKGVGSQEVGITYTVGSSGAVMGLVIAYGFLFKDRMISLLFPPISVKAKWLALGWVLLDLLFYLEGRRDVAYFAHLGGICTAILYMKLPWHFSPSSRARFRGLTAKDHLKRWKTRRHLRLIEDRDKQEQEKKDKGPTFH